MIVAETERHAIMSACGRYRYHLRRSWGADSHLLWVMLNPSTANAQIDDPTIRRCIGFARAHGYGGTEVVNLFAFRATNPGELRRADDPIGPENDDWITGATLAAVDAGADVVVAWGGQAPVLWERRVNEVLALILDAGAIPKCLGRTLHGAPKHPLYVPADAKLEAFHG